MENNSHNFINRPFMAPSKPSIKTPIQINHKYFCCICFCDFESAFRITGAKLKSKLRGTHGATCG